MSVGVFLNDKCALTSNPRQYVKSASDLVMVPRKLCKSAEVSKMYLELGMYNLLIAGFARLSDCHWSVAAFCRQVAAVNPFCRPP